MVFLPQINLSETERLTKKPTLLAIMPNFSYVQVGDAFIFCLPTYAEEIPLEIMPATVTSLSDDCFSCRIQSEYWPEGVEFEYARGRRIITRKGVRNITGNGWLEVAKS